MGIETNRDSRGETVAEQKKRGRSVNNLGFLARLTARLDKANEKLDRRMEVSEYTEIRVIMQQRLYECSELMATSRIEEERKANPDVFIGRAVDLFNYRRRLTEGEGAITVETFQHGLDVNPWKVLEHSRAWSDVYAQQNSALCDWAHTAPLVTPNDSAL